MWFYAQSLLSSETVNRLYIACTVLYYHVYTLAHLYHMPLNVSVCLNTQCSLCCSQSCCNTSLADALTHSVHSSVKHAKPCYFSAKLSQSCRHHHTLLLACTEQRRCGHRRKCLTRSASWYRVLWMVTRCVSLPMGRLAVARPTPCWAPQRRGA